MNEREYDRIHNECGEGYNQIRAKRDQEEWEASQAEAKKYAVTPHGRIAALRRRIELECGSVAREWGNGEAIDALQKSLYAEIKTIESEINAAFLAQWTPEVTQARRDAWNNMVKAGKFGKVGSKRVNFAAVAKQQETQGWTLEELKKAIALNKK